jgi:small ligand-binding sensory domain FIST
MKAAGSLVLTTTDPLEAGRQAVREARSSLGASPPSLAVLFASPHFLESADALVTAVGEDVGPVPLIGCVAESVIGGTREIESGPAVSLWLANDLGPVETFGMDFVRTPSGGAYNGYRFEPEAPGVHIMLCDPFTF